LEIFLYIADYLENHKTTGRSDISITMKSFYLLFCFLLFLLNPILAQKKVTVRATPADATIFIITATNELKQMGIGTAVIDVPKKSFITIVLQKAGFADLRKVYSTLTDEKLPKEDFLIMKDRMVILKVLPDEAKIMVDNQIVGSGNYYSQESLLNATVQLHLNCFPNHIFIYYDI